MDIKTNLNEAVKTAMKSGDELGKRVIRMALASIKQAEVDRRESIDDAAVIAILQKEIKTRRESLEESQKAGRPEAVKVYEQEIVLLESFLPKAMSADELRALVREVIAETGASSPADMGKVMKAVMPKVAGRAAGDQISQAVRELLQK
jgi:uncharacterized protein